MQATQQLPSGVAEIGDGVSENKKFCNKKGRKLLPFAPGEYLGIGGGRYQPVIKLRTVALIKKPGHKVV